MITLLCISLLFRFQPSLGRTPSDKGLFAANERDDKPQSIATYDTCLGIPDICESYFQVQGKYDQAFDTIRYYVEHCYPQADPQRTLSYDIQGSIQNVTKTDSGRQYLRSWLIHILSLRNDNDWFCRDVYDLGFTYVGNYPAGLSILKFLIDNPRCAQLRDAFGKAYATTRRQQILLWSDTAKNNDPKYFDSTLPSMHMLGLDTLLSFASTARYDIPGAKIISITRVTENPFIKQTLVVLTIQREAYIHCDVFDLLGRKLDAVSYAGICEPGSSTIPLDFASFPAGTYYLRVWTANNEVQTIKLTKE